MKVDTKIPIQNIQELYTLNIFTFLTTNGNTGKNNPNVYGCRSYSPG